MKKLSGFLLGLSLVFGTVSLASAQERSEVVHVPPTVLVISREFVKPGKSGAVHDRSESAFVRAMASAKSPTTYLGLNSVSGKPRALFLVGYDSFAAWEKDQQDTAKNPTLSAALDRAAEADGQLLDSYDQSAWIYRPDQSLNQTGDLVGVRYFEIESFRLKPGHEADWEAAVKLVKDAYSKAMPDAHWAMYENVFGLGSPAYLVITPRRSASEIDAGFQQGPKFMAAMGTDGMKKLGELSAAAIESTETNLFTINPRQSYVTGYLVKADPDFWRPKSAPAAAPKKDKPEAKP